MEKYDLAIIGSGPAGFAAAMRAIDYKKKVCIIEKSHLGGAGIMNGVLTSKTMWELSKDYYVAVSVNRGYRAGSMSLSFKEVRKIVLDAVQDKQYQMLSQIETFSEEHSSDGSLTLKRGHARFKDNHTLVIERDDKTEHIWAENIIIATGSKPRPYPGLDVDQVRIINSDGILNLKKFPEKMLIIGSGIIGCEFATIFSNFKQTEVHLLDRANRVLPYEDDDVSNFVGSMLEKNGVIIHHTANLRTIRQFDDHLEVVLDYSDGHSKVVAVDVALVAIGRIPNTEGLGLEKIGIKKTERGFLDINQACGLRKENNHCHIFAAGDITGQIQLYNIAEHQGRYAIRGLYEDILQPVDYSSTSTLMFFKPIVASVGKNEKQLRKERVPYIMAYYSFSLVNRTISMRATDGFVKILVSDDEEKRILGMRTAGPQASAIVISIAHLINQGNTLEEVLNVIHPHPSVTEAIQECLRAICGQSVYKPKAFPDQIKVHSWKPSDNEAE